MCDRQGIMARCFGPVIYEVLSFFSSRRTSNITIRFSKLFYLYLSRLDLERGGSVDPIDKLFSFQTSRFLFLLFVSET